MNSLPTVPAEITRQLRLLIESQILPAARDANWQSFSESLFEYGHQAGNCFATVQGGPFASPEIARLVHTVRNLGFPGVGQSSWGPTVFAVAADAKSAETLMHQLRQNPEYVDCDYAITQANNSGAAVKVRS